MSSNLRVIVDTNVLISGLFGISDSPSSHILRAIRNQQIILVSSALILEEIQEVLNRKRIVKRTKMSAKERQQFIDDLTKRSYVTVGEQLSTLKSSHHENLLN